MLCYLQYRHVKSLTALRASDCVLSLLVGKLDDCLAVLTLAESGGLDVLEAVNKKLKLSFNRSPKLKEFSIFSTTLVEITGHKPIHCVNGYDYSYKLYYVGSKEGVQHAKNRINCKKKVPKAIDSVSAREKALKSVFESVQVVLPLFVFL